MERDGEIQREADPSDKRTTRIALTRKSRSRFPKAMQALREGEREALAGLSEAEQVLLRELLQRVVRNLEADR